MEGATELSGRPWRVSKNNPPSISKSSPSAHGALRRTPTLLRARSAPLRCALLRSRRPALPADRRSPAILLRCACAVVRVLRLGAGASRRRPARRRPELRVPLLLRQRKGKGAARDDGRGHATRKETAREADAESFTLGKIA